MGDQANYGREILKRQLLALTKNLPEGISVGLADDDITREVMIIGPDGAVRGRHVTRSALSCLH